MRLLCVFLLLGLAGCSTLPQPMVIQKQTLQLVQLDASLFRDCQMETPPSLEDYMLLSKDEREDALVRYTLANMTYLQTCTVEKRTLLKLQQAQQARIDQFNQEEAQRVKNQLNQRKEP